MKNVISESEKKNWIFIGEIKYFGMKIVKKYS